MGTTAESFRELATRAYGYNKEEMAAHYHRQARLFEATEACNSAIIAAIAAYSAVQEITVKTAFCSYIIDERGGQGQGLDLAPENAIVEHLRLKGSILTEERGLVLGHGDFLYVVDPYDATIKSLKFLEILKVNQDEKIGNILSSSTIAQQWEEFTWAPAIVSGPVCSIAGVMDGNPVFTITLNIITGHLVLCFKKTAKILPVSQINIGADPLQTILEQGESIDFDCIPSDANQCITFAGGKGKERFTRTLEQSGIRNFVGDIPRDISPGPSRPHMLSRLCDINAGSIFCNGEPYTEFIQWCPYVSVANNLVLLESPSVSVEKSIFRKLRSEPFSVIRTQMLTGNSRNPDYSNEYLVMTDEQHGKPFLEKGWRRISFDPGWI